MVIVVAIASWGRCGGELSGMVQPADDDDRHT